MELVSSNRRSETRVACGAGGEDWFHAESRRALEVLTGFAGPSACSATIGPRIATDSERALEVLVMFVVEECGSVHMSSKRRTLLSPVECSASPETSGVDIEI